MATSNERAIFAGGCLWGMQVLLRRYPGVISTRVNYTGGDVRKRPTEITEPAPKRSRCSLILVRSVTGPSSSRAGERHLQQTPTIAIGDDDSSIRLATESLVRSHRFVARTFASTSFCSRPT